MKQQYDLPVRLKREAIAEADKELLEQHRQGIFSEGNPNHPMYNNGWNYALGGPDKLFGYQTAQFLAKQYK